MRKIIILSIVLITAIIGIANKYFTELTTHSDNYSFALKLIPEDASVVCSFNTEDMFAGAFKDHKPTEAIIGKQKSEQLSRVYAILSSPGYLKEITSSKKAFISIHTIQADSIDFLFTIPYSLAKDESIEQALYKVPNTSLDVMGKGLYKIEFVDYSKPLFLHVSNGAASASFNERLVIRAGSKDFPRLEKAFLDYLNEQVEKNYKTPLSIYINHTTIPASLRNRLLRVPADSTISLEVPRGFTSLNMNFKSDAIMLNGVSEIDSSLSTYISLFASQKPVTTTINGLAPLETAFYQLYSFSDYPLLLSRIKQNLSDDKKLKQLQQNIATIRAESGIDTDRELKEKIAHEFLVLETKDRQKLAIIRLSNGRSVNFALQLISSPLNETVSRLNYPDVFYYYLGEPLETFKTPYFVVIDNYLILSTSPEMTRRYYEAYKNERLLGFSDTYNKHRQLTANQSTITFFVNTKNSLHPIERTKGIFTNGSDNRNIGRMKGFYGLTFQLSADKGKFNTNLYTNIED